MKSRRFQQNLMRRFMWLGMFQMIFLGDASHMGFQIDQLDTFYNALNSNDQDSLNSAAGGNFLDKMPRECLKFGEHIMVRALILDRKNQTPASAPVKAVEQSCVTCGGGHSYQNCPATNSNIYHDNIQEYVSQAAAANFNQANSGYRPPMVSNQIRPPVPKASVPFSITKEIDKRKEKDNDFQIEKFYEIFRDLRTPLNEKCSGSFLNKFQRYLETLAISVSMENFGVLLTMQRHWPILGIASINPCLYSVWMERFSLFHDLTPTCMTLELADGQSLKPIGIAKGRPSNGGMFHFSSDFIRFLALKLILTSSEVEPTYRILSGDILILEAILNSEHHPLPNHGQICLEVGKNSKSGDDKLPVIIAKDLKDEEKAALLKVLKSHKRAIAWKLSDIKGVSPEHLYSQNSNGKQDYETICAKSKKGYFHDPIDRKIKKRQTFHMPIRNFCYVACLFGYANAPGIPKMYDGQSSTILIEKTMEVFSWMTFPVFGWDFSIRC
ncbi:hypothetical protein Tco_0300754 [Tanacetum coccineum]